MNLDHMCAVAQANIRRTVEQAACRELQEHGRLFAKPKTSTGRIQLIFDPAEDYVVCNIGSLGGAGRIGHQSALRDACQDSRPGAAYNFGGRGLPSIW